MPYESTLWDKFLVNLQVLQFDYNPYFINGVILLLVIFWACFVFSVIKFIKTRKAGEATLKFKILIAIFSVLFLLSAFLFFSCYLAWWYALMSV